MRISNLFYTCKQAALQVWRNKAMTFASLFTITCMLLLLGLFFVIMVNLNLMAEMARDQFDTIQIYLLDEATDEQTARIKSKMEAMDEVDSVQYLSKEEAMAEYRVKWGDNAYLLDNLSENPLPNSLRVTVRELEGADAVVYAVKDMPGIEDIKYYQDTVQKLVKITNAIQTGALVIILALIIVSVVVVSNTVKLTVLARSEEIEIMKCVGATNWFIRGPFLVEGMLIGLIAALISTGVVGLLYGRVCGSFGQEAFLLLSTSLVPAGYLMKNLAWIFIALGLSIGSVGSIRSMRKFLDRQS